MTDAERTRFDALLKDALDEMPREARRAVEEIPVVVDDRPESKLVEELAHEGVVEDETDDDLMGLHTGSAITERSVEESGRPPTVIHIFREPIVEHAGGWDQDNAEDAIYEEIRITLLHEIGHHFGLDEDDLDRLGYA